MPPINPRFTAVSHRPPATMRPLLATLLLGLLGSSLASTTTAFGSAYEWLPHREGVQLAMRTGKPIMYLVHKSWCGACRASAHQAQGAWKSLCPPNVQVPAKD